jgi:hypothetical protein
MQNIESFLNLFKQNNKLSKYIRFKLFVENNLTDHPTIKDIAEKFALNPTVYTTS